MNFQKYFFELVNISLITKSTSIAIRIHLKNKRLQIIDNGIGIPYNTLHQIGEHLKKDEFKAPMVANEHKQCHTVFLNILDVTSTFIIMTKHQHSKNTYAKIFRLNFSPTLETIQNRPTYGTTYTVYFNNEEKVSDQMLNWQEIRETITNLSAQYPQVSFSVRSDDEQRIIFGKRKSFKVVSSKKHNPTVRKSYFSTAYYPTPIKFINSPLGNMFRKKEKSFFKSATNIFPKNLISKKKGFYMDGKGRSKLTKTITSFMNIDNKSEKKSKDEIKNSNNNDKNNERQCSFIITDLRSHNAFNHNKDTKNTKNNNNNDINDNKNQYSFTTMNFKSHSELNNDDNNSINYSNNNNTNINIDKGQCSSTITSLRLHSELNNNGDTKNTFNNKNNTININDNKMQCSFVKTDLKSDSKLNNDDNSNSNENNNNNDNNGNENVEEICIEINPYDLDLSGEWSDWILDSPQNQLHKEPNENNKSNFKIINRKRYSFLPEKLNKLLPDYYNKLSTRQLSDIFGEKCNLKFNLPRRQDDDVRLCNVKRGGCEITMDEKILKQIKVLNQVNFEFIACITEHNAKKLLILIDQHAMDERIRYENLIDDYKTEDNKLLSVTLKRSINIAEVPINYVNLLLLNRNLLANFGINFSDNYNNITINNNNNNNNKSHDIATLSVSTVPKCLLGKKYKSDIDLIDSTRKLLIEIAEKLHNNIGVSSLPLTIHNMIASEACHGAIKFGDPLNLKQCNDLVSYWIETDLPNRCAHGRPIVIPLLFIDSLDKSKHTLTKKRLNFDSLRRNR